MLRSLALQALIFFIIFQLFSWFKTTSMLPTKVKIDEQFYQLPTLTADTIEVAAHGKTTIIYFFAPWCQICHISIGNLQTLYEKNQHIDVIAIALDFEDVGEINEFTAQHQLTFPVTLGNEQIKKAFKITGYPSYYVLNEQNMIVARSVGYSSELGLYLRSL